MWSGLFGEIKSSNPVRNQITILPFFSVGTVVTFAARISRVAADAEARGGESGKV